MSWTGRDVMPCECGLVRVSVDPGAVQEPAGIAWSGERPWGRNPGQRLTGDPMLGHSPPGSAEHPPIWAWTAPP